MDRNDIRNGMLVLYGNRPWKVIDRRSYDAMGDLKKGGRYLRVQEWDHSKQQTGTQVRHCKPAELRMFSDERIEEMVKADTAAFAASEKVQAEFNEVNQFFESIGLPGQVNLYHHSLSLTIANVPSYWSIRSWVVLDEPHPSGHTDPMRIVLCEFGVLEPVPTGGDK